MLRIRGVLGVYIGYEYDNTERKVFSKAWFRELTPPWRVGQGLRIRVGPMHERTDPFAPAIVGNGEIRQLPGAPLPSFSRAVQIGRYTKNTEEDMTALKQLGGRELTEFDPSVIGGWHGQGVQAPGNGPESAPPTAS